jgi:hypothetical protein
MTKEKFIKTWNELDDEMRVRWLAKIKDNQNNPESEIFIDNDEVILCFTEKYVSDDRTILSFDNHGYHLLEIMFKAMGLKASLV